MVGVREFIDAFKVKHEDVISKGVKLQIVESNKVRMFKLDGATNSKINKKSIYTGGFWDYFIPLAYAYSKPRILMIGLGIGTIPYQLHTLLGDKIKLDIVEYDRNVIALAKKYAPRRLKDSIFLQDGCEYVVKTKKNYDLIILDAFGKGARIPKQFYSELFVRNASRILKPNGILAINYAMHPYGMFKFVGYRRLLKEFFSVYKISTNSLGDMQVILCSKSMEKEHLMKRIRKAMEANKENRILIKSYSLMTKL